MRADAIPPTKEHPTAEDPAEDAAEDHLTAEDTAEEEFVAPQPDPALADVAFDDVTVVVLASARRIKRLARWADRWQQDPELSRCQVVVVHRGATAEDLGPALEALDWVRVIELEAPGDPVDNAAAASADARDQDAILEAYAQVFDSLTTPWFCLSTLPRRFRRYSRNLKARLAKELGRVADLDLRDDRAVLLHNRHRGRLAPRAYIWHTVHRLGPQPPRVFADYLGFLALASGTHKLEGVDLRAADREIELFGRATFGRFNSASRPPWNYRFAVSDPAGQVSTERPATLEQRIDNQGGRRWENVVGRLPVDEVPQGNHRLMIGIDTPYPTLQSLRSLSPRPGVLAPARTVLLRPRDAASGQTRYLIHTVNGTRTWILLQRGVGDRARRDWDRAMVRKDARMILRGARGNRRMRLARLVRLVTRPGFRHRSIWLVGERADTAQDNGFHLFRHLREAHPERDVYYIIDRGSPQFERVKDLGHVVGHSTLRHRLLMMHATVLANAYSIKHMIPETWPAQSYARHLAWRVGAHRVYLKHGVHVSPTAVKRGTGGYDLYLAVNSREAEALRESSGYRDQIVETGMPRYDTLRPAPSSRTVLFMPTWRRYLVPKLFGGDAEATVPFEGSTYERFFRGLLTSPRLHEILTRHDFRLQVLPHYNLRQELEDFELTSDRTEFADTTARSFQDLIRGCDAFVTDYSSVHFDVAYLGTPIIYTHFDREEYEEGHAVTSWFDHETDGFGPVVHTLEETLEALDDLLSRGCARDPAYADRVAEAFTFQDHRNGERVVAAIDDLVARADAGW